MEQLDCRDDSLKILASTLGGSFLSEKTFSWAFLGRIIVLNLVVLCNITLHQIFLFHSWGPYPNGLGCLKSNHFVVDQIRLTLQVFFHIHPKLLLIVHK